MKIGYSVAFIATILILCFCVYKANKRELKIAKTMRNLFITAIIAIIANLVLLISVRIEVCIVAYSIFSLCIDWVLFFLFYFVWEYANMKMLGAVQRSILFIVLLVDSFSLLLNSYFYHVFECIPVYSESGELFYRIKTYMPYTLHLIISYALIAVIFAVLIYKSAKSLSIYKMKYLTILMVLIVAVIGDGIYVFCGQDVDVSVVVFAIAGAFIYYFTIVYVPKELLHRTAEMALEEMSDGIIIFDINLNLAQANTSAYSVFDIPAGYIDSLEETVKNWITREKIDLMKEAGLEWVDNKDKKTIYYHIQIKCLYNERHHYLGSYCMLHDHTEEVESFRKTHYMATHDKLTGIYNKERFFEMAAAKLHENPKEPYLLVCSDVKNFKFVNDVFGTEEGDKLLQRIAKELEKRVSQYDVYGRFDNDRFSLLMRKRDFKESVFIADQSVLNIHREIHYDVNIFIGVYEITDYDMPISAMCDRAFLAISTVKGNLSKKVGYYTDTIRNNAILEIQLMGEMNHAIKTHQFEIYLQPQVIENGTAKGAEALVRWNHPNKGLLMPGSFIEMFEKNGTIAVLDMYVWELACKQLSEWKKMGREDMAISVNISPNDFFYIDINQVVCGLARKYDINKKNLKLEITETAVMMDPPKQIACIDELRKSGFEIEMDDFGSGQSSLHMLKDISVDVLKIDMAFLGETRDSKKAKDIIQVMINLAKTLGMEVITEGVETKEQVDMLAKMGCEYFQGYYFDRPMKIGEFEEKYMKK